MKKVNAIFLAAAVVLGAMASTDALAHGYRTRVGVYIGAPIGFGYGYGYAPWYGYPAPYYHPYYPAAAAYPSGPTNYVEQAAPEASSAPRSDAYWYYCPDSKTYYPYVNQCAGGWQKVSPKPPS